MSKFGLLCRVFLIIIVSAMNLSYMATPGATAQNRQFPDGGQPLENSGEGTARGDNTCQSAQCEQIIAQLQQQKSLLTRELAQIKREIAVLRETLSEPGLQEVFAGIGYILGLVGIAFYVHCRKSGKDS